MLASTFLLSCEKKKDEAHLLNDFRNFDGFLRFRPFQYDSMKIYLAKVDHGFDHSASKELSYESWKTSVAYKWNADSSLTRINSLKHFPIGFSREVIIHSGDSILFIHRFSTQPLGMQRHEDYTFLESIYYLTEFGTIKHLARISYRERDLQDTIAFRKKPFADLTDDVSHFYSLELNYSKNILTLN
ncbi:MAG TPA: hypothetical protein VFO54_09120 [Chryseosolibacter sp.]|nr:hypothetical protein [Chryseosolibacter sp.]